MKVPWIVLFVSSVVSIGCCQNKREIEDLSTIVRHFSARIASYLISPPYGSTDNFVFSGMRLVSSLVTMHALGSANIKAEIKSILGLTRSLEKKGCDVMKVVTEYKAVEATHFGVLFNSTLFHRPNMNIKSEAVGGPCVAGMVQPLDFTNKPIAIATVNEWYDVWGELFYSHYLIQALEANTNELFMSRLRMRVVMETPFQYSDNIQFTNIKGNKDDLEAMEKAGNFAFKFSVQHKVYMLREDFPGDRFSSVIILPKYETEDFESTLKALFEVELFSNILLTASSLSNKTNMWLRMPELQVKTRVDVKDILQSIGLRSINDKKSLQKLTSETSQIFQLPHSEFIQHVADELGSNDKSYIFEVSQPFIFVILDKKFCVPLKVVVFTGLNKFGD